MTWWRLGSASSATTGGNSLGCCVRHTFAVQIAKAVGARVIATASTRNGDSLREPGADDVIDSTQGGYIRAVRAIFPNGVDVALSCIAGGTKYKITAAGSGWF